MRGLLGYPDRAGLVALEAALGAEERHAHRAGMANAPEFVDAEDAAVGHLEPRALVAEAVLPRTAVAVDVGVFGLRVLHAEARDVRGARARDRDAHADRVRGVVHGRVTGQRAPV